jgi:hypothetical protein
MRQLMEGGFKNAPKPVVAKHALPVVWFHEEPIVSAAYCTERYRGKNKARLPETVESVKLFPVGPTSCLLCLYVKCSP